MRFPSPPCLVSVDCRAALHADIEAHAVDLISLLVLSTQMETIQARYYIKYVAGVNACKGMRACSCIAVCRILWQLGL